LLRLIYRIALNYVFYVENTQRNILNSSVRSDWCFRREKF